MSARVLKSNIKLKAAVVSALMVAAAGIAAAADTGLTPADRAFLNKAAQGGLMEVAAGKLASQRALDPAVKTFGERMVSDHTAANDTLKSLASSKQMPLPDAVSAEEHEALGKLEGLNGTEFDKAYSKMMVKDHVTDISDFEKEVKKGDDADVKAFAQQTLPTLRHHLMLANRLSAAEKKSPSQMSGPPAEPTGTVPVKPQ
jgi:putative membrane protein